MALNILRYGMKTTSHRRRNANRYRRKRKSLTSIYGINTRGRTWKFKPEHAYKDYDGDGKVNKYDCRPLNPKKQDNMKWTAEKYIKSEEEDIGIANMLEPHDLLNKKELKKYQKYKKESIKTGKLSEEDIKEAESYRPTEYEGQPESAYDINPKTGKYRYEEEIEKEETLKRMKENALSHQTPEEKEAAIQKAARLGLLYTKANAFQTQHGRKPNLEELETMQPENKKQKNLFTQDNQYKELKEIQEKAILDAEERRKERAIKEQIRTRILKRDEKNLIDEIKRKDKEYEEEKRLDQYRDDKKRFQLARTEWDEMKKDLDEIYPTQKPVRTPIEKKTKAEDYYKRREKRESQKVGWIRKDKDEKTGKYKYAIGGLGKPARLATKDDKLHLTDTEEGEILTRKTTHAGMRPIWNPEKETWEAGTTDEHSRETEDKRWEKLPDINSDKAYAMASGTWLPKNKNKQIRREVRKRERRIRVKGKVKRLDELPVDTKVEGKDSQRKRAGQFLKRTEEEEKKKGWESSSNILNLIAGKTQGKD